MDVTERKKAEKELHESERRFREMIDALPAAIYTTDAGGRLTHFNPAAAEFSGRVPDLGTDQWCVSWKMFRPDGTPLPHDQCPMAVALKEGRIMEGTEAIAERPDGTRVWFTPYPRPLHDAEGRIVGGINMLVDITQRKQAEQTTGLLAAIVDCSDDAIVSKSLDGFITSWNKSAERLFGYTAEEAIGQHITLIIPPDHQDEEATILERLKRGERVDHFETVRQRKDGTVRSTHWRRRTGLFSRARPASSSAASGTGSSTAATSSGPGSRRPSTTRPAGGSSSSATASRSWPCCRPRSSAGSTASTSSPWCSAASRWRSARTPTTTRPRSGRC